LIILKELPFGDRFLGKVLLSVTQEQR